MKLLLIIDHFGPGGAQRQMVELACGLKRRGHEVEMFIYFPEHDFFRPLLREHRIVVHDYAKGRGFSPGALAKLVRLVRGRRYDVIVSYLPSANIYAELAILFSGGTKLVVSERTSHHDDKAPLPALIRRLMHGLADQVVANSRTQSDWLQRKWWLKRKSIFIYNGVNLQRFSPKKGASGTRDGLHLVGIGRVGPEKNILNLIAALSVLREETGTSPHISWAGSRDESDRGRLYCRHVDEALAALPDVRRRWSWLGVEADVPGLLRCCDALILPSIYEGLPNVVCEALATGVPVLASDVCDHSLLVADGLRGFLFDPQSPRSIASAIGRFRELRVDERERLARNAREYAEANLGVEKMVSSFESVFTALLLNR